MTSTHTRAADPLRTRRLGYVIAAALGLATLLLLQRTGAQDKKSVPATPAGPTPAAAAPATEPTEPPHDPSIARITFTTSPPVHATVSWGTTRLGRITPQQPLVVDRPRDSGPLDVIVRANGFLPVHTRAHTFADHKLQVKLTRPSQKSTLLGYRAPLDAGTELTPEELATQPDGGVPLAGQPAPAQPAPGTPAPAPAPGSAPAPVTPVAPAPPAQPATP